MVKSNKQGTADHRQRSAAAWSDRHRTPSVRGASSRSRSHPSGRGRESHDQPESVSRSQHEQLDGMYGPEEDVSSENGETWNANDPTSSSSGNSSSDAKAKRQNGVPESQTDGAPPPKDDEDYSLRSDSRKPSLDHSVAVSLTDALAVLGKVAPVQGGMDTSAHQGKPAAEERKTQDAVDHPGEAACGGVGACVGQDLIGDSGSVQQSHAAAAGGSQPYLQLAVPAIDVPAIERSDVTPARRTSPVKGSTKTLDVPCGDGAVDAQKGRRGSHSKGPAFRRLSVAAADVARAMIHRNDEKVRISIHA